VSHISSLAIIIKVEKSVIKLKLVESNVKTM